jgi:hypothetical protein
LPRERSIVIRVRRKVDQGRLSWRCRRRRQAQSLPGRRSAASGRAALRIRHAAQASAHRAE